MKSNEDASELIADYTRVDSGASANYSLNVGNITMLAGVVSGKPAETTLFHSTRPAVQSLTCPRHAIAKLASLLLIAPLLVGISSVIRADESTIVFSRDIRPILAGHCFNCHGPDEGSREGELRLDTEEGATKITGG
jgi:hypothetical protein